MQTFLLYNWFLPKNINFCKFANFFADSKSRAQALSYDVSFVIFGHQTWDLKGVGGQIDPPSSVSWFSSTPAGIGLSEMQIYEEEIRRKNKRIYF